MGAELPCRSRDVDWKSLREMTMGFFALLGLVFITLKLIGIIAWSWWLVTLPLWGGFALLFAFFFIVGTAVATHKAIR